MNVSRKRSLMGGVNEFLRPLGGSSNATNATIPRGRQWHEVISKFSWTKLLAMSASED